MVVSLLLWRRSFFFEENKSDDGKLASLSLLLLSVVLISVLIDGEDSCQTLVLKMNGLQNTIKNKKFTSSLHLQELAEEISMVKQIKINCEEKQSKPPSQMFDRPSGLTYATRPSPRSR